MTESLFEKIVEFYFESETFEEAVKKTKDFYGEDYDEDEIVAIMEMVREEWLADM